MYVTVCSTCQLRCVAQSQHLVCINVLSERALTAVSSFMTGWWAFTGGQTCAEESSKVLLVVVARSWNLRLLSERTVYIP
jgi:hypothetical protein